LEIKYTFDAVHALIKLRWLHKSSISFKCSGALLNIIDEEHARIHAFLVDLENARFVKPLNALACLPEPKLYAVFCAISVRAQTMLLSFVPPALVLSAISPIVNPKALFFVVFILSVVSDSVLIEVNAEPMHVVHFPLPVVLTSIVPKIDPVSVNFVVKPLSFKCRSVCPFIDSKALFLAQDVAALISGPLWPRFDALTVLLVVFPVT
jgi:hypothetical protein